MILKKILVAPINFYQKFISPILPKSCRYYPSCSEYAKQQLIKNKIHKALFYATLRILRCNQLFAGGIDYPIVDFKKPNILFLSAKQKIVWWYVPQDNNKAILIKHF